VKTVEISSPDPSPHESPVGTLLPRPGLRLAVFDFDGTLSWLRHGWPGIMCGVFREHLRLRPGESEEALSALLLDEILVRNGQPSIRQCQRLAEIVGERGGPALDAVERCAEFQRRLDAAIERRTARLAKGEAQPGDYLIGGARPFLAHVAAAGLTPVILSSTIQRRVEEEAALLGIAGFFGGRIHGGASDPRRFSKREVFERLLREANLSGEHLLAFGDGPVEIRAAVELGGVAVAVCSDEEDNHSGAGDERKRRQLSAAGAHAVVPNFYAAPALLDRLLDR
jgi:phosphoglycolate phosphatase